MMVFRLFRDGMAMTGSAGATIRFPIQTAP
ncbi:hypothetical protein FHS33_004805 [Streptomyces calvus]|uniref:Uncharacterized protein n=1 Tax=Streptomyces calvus TaxID=67282 RepID=A0AA40VHQ5_9ACTN|nr:hypothetical protein [Streptomyces calvus]